MPATLFAFGRRCLSLPTRSGFHETPLLTKQDVADLLGVSRVTVLGWVQTKKLVPTTQDRATGVPLFDLTEILVIARNAIRAGLAADLMADRMPGPAASTLAPR